MNNFIGMLVGTIIVATVIIFISACVGIGLKFGLGI